MRSAMTMDTHKGMLVKLAKRYARPGVERDDLIAEGYIGLIEAEGTYDASKGASFATHAFYQVRMRMLNYARTFARAGSAFKGREGRKAFLGKGDAVQPDARLDAPVSTENAATMVEGMPSDEPTPEAIAIETEQASLLATMVADLDMDEREAALWTNMMADEPETLEALAVRFGVTKQRMGQISSKLKVKAQKALRKLAA